MMPPDDSNAAASDEPLDRLLKAAARQQEERPGGGSELGNTAGGNDDSAPGAGIDASATEKDGTGAQAMQSSSSCGEESKQEDDAVVEDAVEERTGSPSSEGINGGAAAPTNRRTLIHAPYHDYSRSLPTPGENEQLGSLHNPAAPSALARSQHAKEPTFPLKLHMILARAEWQDIICWLPHGRSFRILNPNAFEDVVLPLYFQHGRYASFARQLNGWNFRRIARGTDFNSYYHELFLRGLPHLCLRMKRLTAKDMAEQKKEIAKQHQQHQHQSSSHDGVNHGGPSRREGDPPDFYSLSRDNPLPSPNDSGSQGGGSSPLPAPLSTFLQGMGGAPVAAPPAISSYTAPTNAFGSNMQPPVQHRSLPALNQLPMHQSPSQDPNQNLMGLLLALSGSRPAAPTPAPQPDVASLLALLAHAMNPASPMSLLLKALSNSSAAAPPPVAPPNSLGGMTSGPTSDLLIQALAHALVQSNRQVAAPAPPPPPQGSDLQQQLILQLLSSLLAPNATAVPSPAVGNGSATNNNEPSAPAPAPETTVRTQQDAGSALAPSDVLPPSSSSPATQQVSPLLQALLGGLGSSGNGAAASAPPPPIAPQPPKPVSPPPALPTDPAQLQVLLQLLASQQQSSSAPADASKVGSPSEAVPVERGPSPS